MNTGSQIKTTLVMFDPRHQTSKMAKARYQHKKLSPNYPAEQRDGDPHEDKEQIQATPTSYPAEQGAEDLQEAKESKDLEATTQKAIHLVTRNKERHFMCLECVQ